MKAKDVVLQLYAKLPFLNDKFTDQVSVDSISVSGDVATVVAPNHGLETGYVVTVKGAQTTLPISMERVGTTIECSTSVPHDLTLGYQEFIETDGAAESEFNGQFELIDVPNRQSFVLRTVDSGPNTASGNPVLLNGTSFGFNGLHQVKVLDENTFTYSLPITGLDDAVGQIEISAGYRISASTTAERCVASYTEQETDQFWAFVVLGNVFASKDRHTLNDSVLTKVGNQNWKQEVIQPFSVYVFSPAVGHIAAADLRDDMEDLAKDLFQCLLGVKFPTGLTSTGIYQTVFSHHRTFEYNSSYYVHEFAFQSLADITFGDTVGEDFNVAFRDIEFSLATDQMTANTVRLTGSVDLDDQPLNS